MKIISRTIEEAGLMAASIIAGMSETEIIDLYEEEYVITLRESAVTKVNMIYETLPNMRHYICSTFHEQHCHNANVPIFKI